MRSPSLCISSWAGARSRHHKPLNRNRGVLSPRTAGDSDPTPSCGRMDDDTDEIAGPRTLRFAESNFGGDNFGSVKYSEGGVGSRLFDVYCNGVILLDKFDIFKEADGANRAIEKAFHGLRPNGQGKLFLSFVPVKDYPTVRAIEVTDESR